MLNRILVKITSSKFWVYLSVFIVSVLVMFDATAATQEKTAAMIIAFGNVVVYTLGNVLQKNIGGGEGDTSKEAPQYGKKDDQ